MTEYQKILFRKLYLRHYQKIALVNNNVHSLELTQLVGTFSKESQFPYEVLFVHVFSTEDMRTLLNDYWQKQAITQGGLIYLVYPKLKQGYYQGIHRDSIFPALSVDECGYVFQTEYKFVRMVSLNDIFTIIGVKYVPIRA